MRYHQGVIDTTLGVRFDNIGASFGLRAEIGYPFMALLFSLAAATLAVVPDPKHGHKKFATRFGVCELQAPCGRFCSVLLGANREGGPRGRTGEPTWLTQYLHLPK